MVSSSAAPFFGSSELQPQLHTLEHQESVHRYTADVAGFMRDRL